MLSLLVLSLLAVDADEASDVCRLGGRSQSTGSADHQQARSWHGRGMSSPKHLLNNSSSRAVHGRLSIYHRNSWYMARRGRWHRRLAFAGLKRITTTENTRQTTLLFQCPPIALEKGNAIAHLVNKHSDHRMECYYTPCPKKKLSRFVFVRTSSNFHQFR